MAATTAPLPDPTDEQVSDLDRLILADEAAGAYAAAWKQRDPWEYQEALKRFFCARKRDTQPAYEMLRLAIAWRLEYGADRVYEHAREDNKNFELLDRYWPGRFIGLDRRGLPVWIERFGHTDPSSLLELVPAEELVHYHVYIQENMARRLREANAALPEERRMGVLRHIAIEDLDNLGMKHYHSKGLELLKACIKIDEGCYPERLSRLYVVNAPTVFRVIWAVIKPWLDPRTLAKITILGSDFTQVLQEHVSPDQLPVGYGGTLDHPLPTNSGTYVDLLPSGLPLNPRKVTVGRRDVHEVEFAAAFALSVLSWDFSTEGNDIGMGVKQKGTDHFVLPIERIESQNGSTGSLEIAHPGSYVMVFDNTYSRFTAKTLRFHLTLREPSPEPTV